MKHISLLLVLFLSLTNCTPKLKKTAVLPLSKPESKDIVIAFGSCNDQDKKQPLWDEIIAEQPDVWVWLGDNIYGDTDDVDKLRAMYAMQKAQPAYATLCQQTNIIGTWDDHDYGINNIGKEWGAKDTHQQALLDFLDVPADDVRRTRNGVYTSYNIEQKGIKIKIFLLDARYFRDEHAFEDGEIVPRSTGTILGEKQWNWLQEELESSMADVHIFASGIQVIPEEHRFEKWANFPRERDKLFDLIKTYNTKQPIFISGDRHIGEISTLDHKGKQLTEITSSSLTHGWSKRRPEANKHRHGEIVYEINYGVLRINPENLNIQAAIKTQDALVKSSIQIH